jgi:DNA topoisomerase III
MACTDCDREGQLIGQEILEHYEYRGQVMRVLFTAQDSQTIRDAFSRAKPNAEYARLPARAVSVTVKPRSHYSIVTRRRVAVGIGQQPATTRCTALVPMPSSPAIFRMP